MKPIKIETKYFTVTCLVDKNLGYFKTEKEAAMCRDKIALTNRGIFARLNFGGTNGK